MYLCILKNEGESDEIKRHINQMHKIDLANVSLSKMYGITTKTEISSGFSFQNTAKLRQ